MEKGVDKWGQIWYSTKAVCSTGSAAEKVLKNLKKVLDKRDRVWYSIKAVCSAEGAVEKKVEKQQQDCNCCAAEYNVKQTALALLQQLMIPGGPCDICHGVAPFHIFSILNQKGEMGLNRL